MFPVSIDLDREDAFLVVLTAYLAGRASPAEFRQAIHRAFDRDPIARGLQLRDLESAMRRMPGGNDAWDAAFEEVGDTDW